MLDPAFVTTLPVETSFTFPPLDVSSATPLCICASSPAIVGKSRSLADVHVNRLAVQGAGLLQRRIGQFGTAQLDCKNIPRDRDRSGTAGNIDAAAAVKEYCIGLIARRRSGQVIGVEEAAQVLGGRLMVETMGW